MASAQRLADRAAPRGKRAMWHELILGGVRSGKSRAAEGRAAAWLRRSGQHRATLVATALAGDAEMDARIARHRAERSARVPALETVEAPHGLGAALRRLADPARLLVVDCLTLWTTQCLLPPPGVPVAPWPDERDELLAALRECASPVVLVSNEIGLGVVPLASGARACIDALGQLHQAVAQHCARVTLMVAGQELKVKELP
jgi:adenosylcobinamide kinase/adenosylcobinamide-phosphate guanylyltransferase